VDASALPDGKWGRELHRRDIPAACDNSCPWISQFLDCTTDGCECAVIIEADLSAVACANCLRPFNSTFASLLDQVIVGCGSLTSTTITNGTATVSVQCTSECNPINQALSACNNDYACICPTLLSAGPPCSGCYATINATYASDLGQGIAICQTESLSAGSYASSMSSTTSSTISTASFISPSSSPTPGISRGAVGGIVGGLFGLFVLVGGLIYLWVRSRRFAETRSSEGEIPVAVEQGREESKAGERIGSEDPQAGGRLQYPDS